MLIQIARKFSFVIILCTAFASASFGQGMDLDSLNERLSKDFGRDQLAGLKAIIPDYLSQRVWGLAVGDFTHDSVKDLALSLYNTHENNKLVTVYLLENSGAGGLIEVLREQVPYFESPIEVGLTVEANIVTILAKQEDQHWTQEGYTVEDGDLIQVEQFETDRENVGGIKNRSVGHELYRNFQTLFTKESYFTSASGDALSKTSYFTFPAYQRLRSVYPGYGYSVADSTTTFVVSGSSFRRDARDLSIQSAVTAFDDDYLYFSIRVRDEAVVGGQEKPEANDRLSLWFDTKLGDDRTVLSRRGGFPTFRTKLDSLVYSLTFLLPEGEGRLTKVLYSSIESLTSDQQAALDNVKGVVSQLTQNDFVTGYELKLRIPFAFLGFEGNPVRNLENRNPELINRENQTTVSVESKSELLRKTIQMGFTAVVYDVDDPIRPNETSVQATSKFEPTDPTSLGTLMLLPSNVSYGFVNSTYLTSLIEELKSAGF